MWEKNGRYDILAWVMTLVSKSGRQTHEIWFNPETGDQATRCPWLRKLPKREAYVCRIHDMKPSRCRDWRPGSRSVAAEIGCRGFDP